MATGFFHHVGTFLLLVAVALLIVTDISAPVVDEIGLLKVNLGQGNSVDQVSFGTFGWCLIRDGPARNLCSASTVGYSAAEVMREVDGTPFSDYAMDTTDRLTKVMILHPIATGIAFIAFALSLGANFAGSLLAALVAMLAFIVTLVALICDFVLFSVIRSNVNDQNTGAYAYYSIAMWTLLVSAICLLFGTIIVFFTCCSGRLHRSRQRRSKVDGWNSPPPAVTTTRRRRWWSRR